MIWFEHLRSPFLAPLPPEPVAWSSRNGQTLQFRNHLERYTFKVTKLGYASAHGFKGPPAQSPPPPDSTEEQQATDPASAVSPPPAVEPIPPAVDSAKTASTYDYAPEESFQTREADDLFADEFEPIAEPVVEEPVIPSQQTLSTGSNSARRPPRQDAHNNQRQAGGVEQSIHAPQGPRQEAVRGDRSKTGGIKKAKLTEDELSQRMEAIKLKNQSLEAAHARAEADQASFNAREAEEREKMKLERQNRQQMMGERERNRLRKLNAQGGRDWDMDKEEESAPLSRGSRPAADRKDQDLSQYIYQDDDRGGYRGRGRGRGRGGRGRGGVESSSGRDALKSPPQQRILAASDFPSLPKTQPPPKSGTPQRVERGIKSPQSSGHTSPTTESKGPGTNNTSWAEEMETPDW